MQFIDLNAQQLKIRSDLNRRIEAVLSHGQYIMGPEVRELEKRLADFVGMKHCITCSSGTDGLLIALKSYGVGQGDAVFTSTFTFIATAEVISILGATPVFVDIDPETYNIDPLKLKQAIEQVKTEGRLRIKGVIPVDLFGLPAEYDSIISIAKEYGLFIIEDAAQSFGAVYNGRKAGGLGHVGVTSFFPAKPLGCYGDGGAVFTDDDELAETMSSIRTHGSGNHKYENIRLGINGRLDTIQAAILLAKLEIFEKELEVRQSIAKTYTERLVGVVEVPSVPKGLMSAWAQYSIRTEKREEVQRFLKTKKIPTAIYYPKPLHLQPAFSYLGYGVTDFPIAEDISKRILSIPMHPYLEDTDIHHIVNGIKSALK